MITYIFVQQSAGMPLRLGIIATEILDHLLLFEISVEFHISIAGWCAGKVEET